MPRPPSPRQSLTACVLLLCGCVSTTPSVKPATTAPGQPLGTTAERRALLNTSVAARDYHDAFLELIEIGDPSSVTPLITALARQPRLSGTGPFGMVDTHLHILDALETITNQDAGRNAEDWQRWYDQNAGKTHRQWVLDGFERLRFPVATPVDEPFALSLIRASDPAFPTRYTRINARRLLREVPLDTVLSAGRTLLTGDAVGRRGLITALEERDGDQAAAVLRGLVRDTDITVAEDALRALNQVNRRGRAKANTVPLTPVLLGSDSALLLGRIDERTVVLGVRPRGTESGVVVAYDLTSRRVRWRYLTEAPAETAFVRRGDRLFFVSDDRVLHCISTAGSRIWAATLTAAPDRLSGPPTLVATVHDLFVADTSGLYTVDMTGRVRTLSTPGKVFDLVEENGNVFAAIWNGPLVVLTPDRVTATANGLNLRAVSAKDGVVCAVSMGPVHQLQCLDTRTLEEMWRVGLPYSMEGYDELQQSGDQLYVLAQGRAHAYRTATGERLWATNQFRSFSRFVLAGDLILAADDRMRPEWRDARSGEVLSTVTGGYLSITGEALRHGDALLLGLTDLDKMIFRESLAIVPFPARR